MEEPSEEQEASIWLRRGSSYDHLERPVKAAQSFQHVLINAPEETQKGEAAFRIGEIYFEQKSYPQALHYYAQALANFESIEDGASIIKVRFKTAIIHGRQGNAEMALSLLRRIMYDENADPIRKAIATAELGKIHYQIAQFDSSRFYLELANTTLEDYALTEEALENLEVILQTHHAEGNTALAIETAETAANIAVESGDQERALFFLIRLAIDFKEQEQNHQALRYAELASEHMGAVSQEQAIELNLLLADLYSAVGQNTEALLSYNEAESRCIQTGNHFWREQFARSKSAFFEKEGRFEEALAYMQLADSLQTINNESQTAQLRREAGSAKFNVDSYPQMSFDGQSEQDEHLFTRLQNIIIVGLIFFTIVIFLLLREFTQKRKLSKVLEWKVYKRTRELRKANKELNTYIYKSSHDLRTPLTSIKSLLRLLEKEEHNASTKKYLGLIHSCTDQMDDILLNLSKAVDYKKVDVKVEQIDFNKLRYQIQEKELASVSNMNIQWDIEENGAFFSDSKLLKVILHQTIQNAVAYRQGKQDDYCKISIHTDSEGAELCIEDNGQGISEKVRDKVFDMFVKGTHKSTGAGLGLYLVRIASEKIRAKVTLQTEEQQGCKLTFLLPNLN